MVQEAERDESAAVSAVNARGTCDLTVWFNPACGTCRGTRDLLAERALTADYVHYLEQTPDRAELERVLGLLGLDDPRGLMRTREPVYAELGLASPSVDRNTLIDAMVSHPILIQRPVVIRGDRAVIARPRERVLELLE